MTDEYTDVTEMAPRPSRWRRWLVGTLLGLALTLVLLSAGAASVVAPYVLDDMALDRAVAAVALDWRDYGEERARERLQYELDHQGIGLQVGDDDCTLSVQEELRVVACHWGVLLRIPGVAEPIPLAFESVAEVGPDGDLR